MNSSRVRSANKHARLITFDVDAERPAICHARLTSFVAPTDRYAYRPRPGIVLDDTLDYTGTQGLATQRPYAPPRHPPLGDIFDVTVSAVQGPGGGSSGKQFRSIEKKRKRLLLPPSRLLFLLLLRSQKVSECR